MIRRLYLAALFTIITYITYLGFDSRVTLVLSLALSLSILVWWMGYAYLALLGGLPWFIIGWEVSTG
ncbi:hypothetical protein [Thermococcus sp. JCM 11816]|uniref:hypothetical protein n=1 Tax=Thermococcus sp. (strain JCM 11816 / KS-1) TaxID=1295125 RepID=UPI0006D2429E